MHDLAQWAQMPEARQQAVEQASRRLVRGRQTQRLHHARDRAMCVAAFQLRGGLNERVRRCRLAQSVVQRDLLARETLGILGARTLLIREPPLLFQLLLAATFGLVALAVDLSTARFDQLLDCRVATDQATVPFAPALSFGGFHLVEQTAALAGLDAIEPTLRLLAQPAAGLLAFAPFCDPVRELRPPAQQRLVRDVEHGIVFGAAFFAAGCDEQPRGDQLAHGLVEQRRVVVAAAQLAAPLLAARVGAPFAELDEPQQNTTRDIAGCVGRQRGQRLVGARRHRDAETAAPWRAAATHALGIRHEAFVGRRWQAAPFEAGPKQEQCLLQERQDARLIAGISEQPLDQRRLDEHAHTFGRTDDRLAERVAAKRRQLEAVLAHFGPQLRKPHQVAVEVGAHSQHDVPTAASECEQCVAECGAAGITQRAREREKLLKLIDDEQSRSSAGGIGDHRLQRRLRVGARPQRADVPVAGAEERTLAQRRHEASEH